MPHTDEQLLAALVEQAEILSERSKPNTAQIVTQPFCMREFERMPKDQIRGFFKRLDRLVEFSTKANHFAVHIISGKYIPGNENNDKFQIKLRTFDAPITKSLEEIMAYLRG